MKLRLRALAGIAALPLVAGMVALASPASANTPIVYYAGQCTARGQYAICVASGTATRPSRIYIHVHTNTSPQRLTVYWDVVCWQGTGAGSRSGSFTAYTPVNHLISHPYTYPAGCDVAADAQINRGSYIHVNNTYYRW